MIKQETKRIFYLKKKNKINLIEVKSGITISSDYFKGLTVVSKAIGEENIKSKTVVYGGNEQQVRKNNEIIKSWNL